MFYLVLRPSVPDHHYPVGLDSFMQCEAYMGSRKNQEDDDPRQTGQAVNLPVHSSDEE